MSSLASIELPPDVGPAADGPAADGPPDRGPRRRLNASLITGAGLALFLLLVALFGPLASPYDPSGINADAALHGPSGGYILGTDELGRDLFVRVAKGYQTAFEIGAGTVALGLLVGVPLGLLAASAGPIVDNVIMRILDVLLSFPALILAVIVVTILGSGEESLILAIGIAYMPIIARVMRGSALSTRREMYIDAVRSRGASPLRIALRHTLPNSAGPLIVQASIFVAVAVLLGAGMSFVGLGVRPPTPELGLMLASGRDYMTTSPWVVAAPVGAIMLFALAFTLIGDGLQSWLDPQSRTR